MNCIIIIDLTSKYVYVDRSKVYCIHSTTHLKIRTTTLFTADALCSHGDLMSLAELGGAQSGRHLLKFPSRNSKLLVF